MPGAKSLYERAVQTYRTLPPSEQALDDVARGHARALQRLGAILLSEGRLAESEERYRAAIALDDAVLARNPANALSGYDMTFSLTDLGLIARKRGDLATAEAFYRRALGIREAALAADPKSVRIMQGVSSAHGYLSGVYYDRGKRADAIVHRRAALRLQEQLRAILGATTRLLSDQAWSQLYLAGALIDEAEAKPSERSARIIEARQLLDQAAAGARESSRGRPMHPAFAKLLEEQTARLRRAAR
jgi:tetratricopeptide (TPR) repeat protein